eukprot:COSAG06_NODE_501_length_14953_cov_25.827858_3_plen_164_part_00
MRRQKAELLVSLEVLMSDGDKDNEEYFPHWIFWYRPAERQDEDTSDENGVINGVQRMLAQQSKEQQGMLDQQSKDQQGMLDQQAKDQAVQIANLTQELAELQTAAQLKQELGEARMQDMGAKVEQTMVLVASMQQEISANFAQLLANGGRMDNEPEPQPEPRP